MISQISRDCSLVIFSPSIDDFEVLTRGQNRVERRIKKMLIVFPQKQMSMKSYLKESIAVEEISGASD
jgi:hypothetical protein